MTEEDCAPRESGFEGFVRSGKPRNRNLVGAERIGTGRCVMVGATSRS